MYTSTYVNDGRTTPPPSKESQISHLHPHQLYYPYGKEHTMKCMMKTGK